MSTKEIKKETKDVSPKKVKKTISLSKRGFIIGTVALSAVAAGGAGTAIYFGIKSTQNKDNSITVAQGIEWINKHSTFKEVDVEEGKCDASEVNASWDFSKTSDSLKTAPSGLEFMEGGIFGFVVYNQLIKYTIDNPSTEMDKMIKGTNVKGNNIIKTADGSISAVTLQEYGGFPGKKVDYVLNIPYEFTYEFCKDYLTDNPMESTHFSNFKLANNEISFSYYKDIIYMPDQTPTGTGWSSSIEYGTYVTVTLDSKCRCKKVSFDVYGSYSQTYGGGTLQGNATFEAKYAN